MAPEEEALTMGITATLQKLAASCAIKLDAAKDAPPSTRLLILQTDMLAAVRAVRTAEQREYDLLLAEMHNLEKRFDTVIKELTLVRKAIGQLQ